MSRRARTASRIGAFVALVFLMTGCIKLNMNLGINSDNTVSGTVEFGVQKELLDLTGQNVEDLLGSDAPFPSSAPGVTIEPFDDGEFAGQQFIFEDLPIEQFNSGGVAGASGATAGGAGDTLNRLEGMVNEERDKAAGRARVAKDSVDMSGINLKEAEMTALADQALADFAAR